MVRIQAMIMYKLLRINRFIIFRTHNKVHSTKAACRYCGGCGFTSQTKCFYIVEHHTLKINEKCLMCSSTGLSHSIFH